jgi:hypothetical protein
MEGSAMLDFTCPTCGKRVQGDVAAWCDGTVRLVAYSTPTGVIRNGVGDGPFAAYLTPTGKEEFPLPD